MLHNGMYGGLEAADGIIQVLILRNQQQESDK